MPRKRIETAKEVRKRLTKEIMDLISEERAVLMGVLEALIERDTEGVEVAPPRRKPRTPRPAVAIPEVPVGPVGALVAGLPKVRRRRRTRAEIEAMEAPEEVAQVGENAVTDYSNAVHDEGQ